MSIHRFATAASPGQAGLGSSSRLGAMSEQGPAIDASQLKITVELWLSERFKGVEERDDGRLFVPRFGSTALFVSVKDALQGSHVIVVLESPVLVDVPVTRELLEYVGYKSGVYLFGHLALVGHNGVGSTGHLIFRHTLLGESLGKAELILTAGLVAATANRLDDDLQVRFGGRRFYN